MFSPAAFCTRLEFDWGFPLESVLGYVMAIKNKRFGDGPWFYSLVVPFTRLWSGTVFLLSTYISLWDDGATCNMRLGTVRCEIMMVKYLEQWHFIRIYVLASVTHNKFPYTMGSFKYLIEFCLNFHTLLNLSELVMLTSYIFKFQIYPQERRCFCFLAKVMIQCPAATNWMNVDFQTWLFFEKQHWICGSEALVQKVVVLPYSHTS